MNNTNLLEHLIRMIRMLTNSNIDLKEKKNSYKRKKKLEKYI